MKNIYIYLLVILSLIIGCYKHNNSKDIVEPSYADPSKINSPYGFDLDDALQSKTFKPLTMVDVSLDALKEGIHMAGSFTLDLACDYVFGPNPGDWVDSNVVVTSSVSIVAGTTCTITMVSYYDGADTYTPISSPLVANVGATGSVTAGPAEQYTTGGSTPIIQWFSASQGSTLFSVFINFANSAITAIFSPNQTTLTSQVVTITVNQIPPPVVSALDLYFLPAINGQGASYTLTAQVTNETGCKFIDNSSATYDPTTWASVNSAYNSVNATTCPVFTDGDPGFTQGNWTAYWVTGQKYLIMWANNVNGLNAYATANIGP